VNLTDIQIHNFNIDPEQAFIKFDDQLGGINIELDNIGFNVSFNYSFYQVPPFIADKG